MFGRKFCGGDVDLFQLAQQALCLCELREDRFVRLGKFVRRGAGQFNQALAAAAQFVALLDFVFLVGDEEDEIEKRDRKSTRLNSSHVKISYAVFRLKKKIKSHS